MANFIVVSPSQTTNGGNSGDLFVFRSGAISGATVVGGTGKDTLELLEPTSSANGVSFNLKGGADVFTISGQALSGKVQGGAGADTVTLNAGNTLTELGLGAGSDNVQASGAITVQTNGSIKGGGGADLISGGNFAHNLSGASVLMGAGKDTIDLNGALTAGTVSLGNGSDDLTISASTISLTGSFLGGKGADVISGNSETYLDVSGLTIGGGAGKDTITLAEIGSAGEGTQVLGGGGNDSITLEANENDVFLGTAAATASFSAGNGYATILGGAGADSITFDGVAGGGYLTAGAGYAGVLGFSALSDSTEGSMDLISYSGSAATTKMFLLDFDHTIATGIAASKGVGAVGTDANGFLATAGANSSVAELISAVDALTVTGEIATFRDASGDAYVFVQGGSTDFVAEFDNTNGTAGAVVLSKEADGEFRLELGDA